MSIRGAVEERVDSATAAQANVLLGDLAFSVGELDDAREAYAATTVTRSSLLGLYAAYRLAWCDIRDGKRDEAAAMLRPVSAGAAQLRGATAARLKRAVDDDLQRLRR